MNVASSIGKAYLRWRHSRGYGVHSPFAYNLVRNAIRPGHGYAWYGYHDIDVAMTKEGRDAYPRLRRDAMLLLRLMAVLQAKRLLLWPGGQNVFRAVADAVRAETVMLGGKNEVHPKPGDFMLVRGAYPRQDEISRRLAAGTVVIAVDPDTATRDTVMAFHGHGLLLPGRRIVIAVPNPDMAFVSYDMRF